MGSVNRSTSRRGVRAAAIAVATALGAVMGAALHPLPADRFQADAVVVVGSPASATGSPNLLEGSWRAFAEAIDFPQVREAVAMSLRGVSASDVADSVRVVGNPASLLLRVRARAEASDAAIELADRVTAQTISFMRRVNQEAVAAENPRASFDFEEELGGWNSGSAFSLPARRFTMADGSGRTGSDALRFACSVPRSGCGPGVRIARAFSPEVSYLAQGYVRAAGGRASLRMVFGSGKDDVAVGKPITVDDLGYRKLSVSWTPRRTSRDATLAVQTTRRNQVSVLLDSVSMHAAGSAETGFAAVGSANAVAEVEARTAKWALLGGLMGTCAAACGLLLSAVARRRAH